jgi:hypothetical protein
MTAPFSGPQEARGLQAKMPGVRDPRPLGAAMDSSAFAVAGSRLKYWLNGAWPSPTSTAMAGSGFKMAIMALSRGP